MKESFWSGGPFAYERGLHEHYEPQLNELRRRLAESADINEQSEIGTKLTEAKAEYREKRKAIGRSLF